MKFKLSTAKMTVILNRVAKGVGSSKVLPITEYLRLTLEDGTLTVIATNSVNFITSITKEVTGKNGEVIVKADQLIKLVTKTTKPEISFTEKEDHLEVKGNGTYKIPLFETNKYPTYEFDSSVKKVEVETKVLKKAFAINSSSVAAEMTMPCLTGYRMGSKAITTDGVKMCINETNILHEDALITQALADLINTLSGEKVVVQKDGDNLLFTTENVIVFGTELDGLDEYPDITPILSIDYPNYAIVNKSHLLDALERLNLFVDPFDNNGVKLTFSKKGLKIEDLKQNSNEILEYTEKSQKKEIGMVVNLVLLKDLLGSLGKESVKFQYDVGQPIKIVEENVSLILSTMDTE